MKKIPVREAVGHVLCHDMTQIIPGTYKGPRFRKGHIVTAEDIPVLLSMGKEHLFVWEKGEGMLHEDEAATRLAALCRNEYMEASPAREGKIELRAAADGFFTVASDRLQAVNTVEDVMIATRHGNTPVRAGDKLCGTRCIPLVIPEETIRAAEQAAGSEPLMAIHPYRLRRAAVITTGSEVFHGRVEDAFTPVLVQKLASYGIEMIAHRTVDDDKAHIMEAIDAMRCTDAEMILCTGGMSVDPDDNTPGAIRDCGARIVTYGAPVLPGAMFLLGYFEDGTPVMGLPGCVMYAKATVFDLVLPRIAAGIAVERSDFVKMGEGGLCLGCGECRYPVCPFGK
ncbi:MAG: molybdopterin-binding protein [Oscillospiraceae bacterium]|nr:molybdopterin-binding protein [Oscillospiraceae bacterium]